MRNLWGLVLVVGVIGCGKSSSKREGAGAGSSGSASGSAPPAAATRWEPVVVPDVSPACAEARRYLGYAVTCDEQELPELTTAAGKVLRLWSKADPTKTWFYALVPPDGPPVVGRDGYSDDILGLIAPRLDLATTPPETLARLWAVLGLQAAAVRCLPGDTLPEGRRRSDKPCAPPTRVERDGKPMLELVVESFPHPHLLNRDKHMIYWYRLSLADGRVSMSEGEGMIELDAAAPLPADAPPLPGMTAPPTWAGPTTPAPADVETALCARAADLLGWHGRTCKAYGYPSLSLPTGELYYLANDAGEAHLIGLRTPDGAVEVNRASAFVSPLVSLIASYDPAKVAPETFLGAYLLLDGRPRRILCLPGAGDKLPDDPCPPPLATKRGEDLVVKAIIHEQPPDEPAVRAIEWAFSPGGGMSGDGARLIDLRAK